MRRLFVFLAFCLALSVPALAVDTGALESALPEAARTVLGDGGVLSVAEDEGLFSRLWEACAAEVSARVGEAARGALVALAAALLCSTAAAASPDGKMPGYVLLGGALAILGSCLGDMKTLLREVASVMDELQDFSRALLPCVAAASAAAGRAASGAARYTVSALFLDLLMGLGRTLVLPSVFAYAAVAAADASLPEGAMGGPVKLLSWACRVLLTGLATVFTLAVTLSGVLSGGADRLAGSVVKTAITAALPVVGKIVADASDAYLAGAKLLRGAVGIFGLAAVLCVCLGPMLRLGLRYLLFKAAAAVAAPFADRRQAELIDRLADCCGMALGLLGCAGFMLFLSVILGTEALTG